jgi:predicted NBD/HSP70 family sugar kinase/biotin operon repressor
LGSTETPRERNRLRVIDVLRRRGTASRSDLAELTGLSRTTVAALVSDLQARGLVVDANGVKSSGRGRPPSLLRLDAAAGAAVGIDFDHPHLRVAVADLASTVLAERCVELDVDNDAAASLDAAVELVDELLEEAAIDRADIVGVGMGLPGPIDRRSGTVAAPILPSWSGIHAGGELASRLGLHVEVDNDANLGALGEVSYGAAQGFADIVYVRVGSGIGAGLLLGGQLYRGAAGLAGELGHVQVRPEGAVCRCGNRGCLESVAGLGAVIGLLQEAHGQDLTLRDVLDLLADGDPGARRAVNDAGRSIGRVLADLCNHLNPAAIIVGGDMSATGEPLLDGIRDSIDRYAQPGVAQEVEVKAGVLGERAEVLGALALVIADTERLRSAGLVALNNFEQALV